MGYKWKNGRIQISPVWLDESAGSVWAAAQYIKAVLDGKPVPENEYDARCLVEYLEDIARETAKMVGQDNRFPETE